MRRNRRARIVATIGPATRSAERIEALAQAGADLFRLNFSHGTHEDHKVAFDIIRGVERKLSRPIGILMDLQGPKLRVGRFASGPIELIPGTRFRLDLDETPGDTARAPLPHPEILRALKPGDDLLLDDGKLRLRVEACDGRSADTIVMVGGRLSERKGVNVPGTLLDISPLTEKDRRDLTYGLDLGADWVGLSFVQRAEDVAEARRLIAGRAAVMAKIEKPSAVTELDRIIELVDACMVARGDLGVELPPEDVPGIQKRIVSACRLAGKPVVVATQMLESMISSPTPTRAEASDCATAVFDGADALMLSAETASGQYPVEAVKMMSRIIERVEQDPAYRGIMDAQHPSPEPTTADAISTAARMLAATTDAAASGTYSLPGKTTQRISRERPPAAIMGLTTRIEVARKLSLLWGVHNVVAHDATDFNDMVNGAVQIAVTEGFAKKGDRIIVTAGVPFGAAGNTNVLRIATV